MRAIGGRGVDFWRRVGHDVPMKLPIPSIDESLLLRTDFSDDEAWSVLCDLLQTPVGEFEASLLCVSDRAFEGLTAARLAELAADEEELTYAFLADTEAMHGEEHTVVVVELWDDPGRTFRVAPQVI